MEWFVRFRKKKLSHHWRHQDFEPKWMWIKSRSYKTHRHWELQDFLDQIRLWYSSYTSHQSDLLFMQISFFQQLTTESTGVNLIQVKSRHQGHCTLRECCHVLCHEGTKTTAALSFLSYNNDLSKVTPFTRLLSGCPDSFLPPIFTPGCWEPVSAQCLKQSNDQTSCPNLTQTSQFSALISRPILIPLV